MTTFEQISQCVRDFGGDFSSFDEGNGRVLNIYLDNPNYVLIYFDNSIVNYRELGELTNAKILQDFYTITEL